MSVFSLFQTIDGVKTTGGHKVIDLLTLLMLHSLANRKRPVESVVRNKIRSGLFTEVLLHAAFSSHAEVWVPSFNYAYLECSNIDL